MHERWNQQATARIWGDADIYPGMCVDVLTANTAYYRSKYDGRWLVTSPAQDGHQQFQTLLYLVGRVTQRRSRQDPLRAVLGRRGQAPSHADHRWTANGSPRGPIPRAERAVRAIPSLPPRHLRAGSQETLTYDDLVRGQVIDALMTNQGERVMRPRYGCDVQAALFDPTDELMRRDAASHLKTRLEQFVSRAIIRSVAISTSDYAAPTPDIRSEPVTVIITVVYRASLYATDIALRHPGVVRATSDAQLEGASL